MTFKKFPKPPFGMPDETWDKKWNDWIDQVLQFREGMIEQLKEIESQLNGILDSDSMKQAERLIGKHIRDRWEGQLAVTQELLEAFK